MYWAQWQQFLLTHEQAVPQQRFTSTAISVTKHTGSEWLSPSRTWHHRQTQTVAKLSCTGGRCEQSVPVPPDARKCQMVTLLLNTSEGHRGGSCVQVVSFNRIQLKLVTKGAPAICWHGHKLTELKLARDADLEQLHLCWRIISEGDIQPSPLLWGLKMAPPTPTHLARVLSVCSGDPTAIHTCMSASFDQHGTEWLWWHQMLYFSLTSLLPPHRQSNKEKASSFIFSACVMSPQLLATLSVHGPKGCSIFLIVVLYHSFWYDAASKGLMHVVTIKSMLKHFTEPSIHWTAVVPEVQSIFPYKMPHTDSLTPVGLTYPTKIKINIWE